jgi:hypothetical protein
MSPEEKRRHCENCLHENGRDAPKCGLGYKKQGMRDGGRWCIEHRYREGWELEEGGLFS